MDSQLNPGSRPRKGVAVVLVMAALAVVTAVAVVARPERADASGLEAFGSCGELSAWGATAQAGQYGGREDGGSVLSGGPATTVAPLATAGSAPNVAEDSAGTKSEAGQAQLDATNVVVDGVDELDLVDRLAGDHVLVIAGSRLAIVDLSQAKALARRTVPAGAQVTYDPDSGVAWVVGSLPDGNAVEVQRVSVGDASLEAAGTWTTPGALVDARRVGDRLHLVASDGFVGPNGTQLPFAGGPVACDQVLHPAGPSQPTASLLVTLPATGDLQPLHAAEVVGSGQLVHVTSKAAYLATPQWSDGRATTAIHRFELAELRHTGSGLVAGTLLNDFSMSDHDGYLRVAITDGSALARPMPVDDVIVDSGTVEPVPPGGPDAPVGTDGSPGGSTDPVGPTVVPADVGGGQSMAGTAGGGGAPVPEMTVPETTVPETTVPESTTTVPASTTTVVGSTTSTSTSTSTTTTTSPILDPAPSPGEGRNRVVVLDTEGDLDIVGRTPWFGHAGELLQGIRFDGAQAYAVTFLQTDPFYVLDLSSPTAPRVAGEVQLPGFSAYLHPVGDGRVVGFGPDADGQVAAKLFDVRSPARPTLVDTLALGNDSPVVADHHALVDLGNGHLAVPVTTWSTVIGKQPLAPCEDIPERETSCASPGGPTKAESSVVELAVEGDALREVSRSSADLAEPASRAIRAGGGWALLGGTQLAFVGADGSFRALLDLSA